MSILTQFGEGSPGDPSGDEGEPDQRRHPVDCREDVGGQRCFVGGIEISNSDIENACDGPRATVYMN